MTDYKFYFENKGNIENVNILANNVFVAHMLFKRYQPSKRAIRIEGYPA